MITEKDLQEAIAECQGQKNPNSNTCIKLASFFVIKDHMYPDTFDRPSEIPETYSEYSGDAGGISYNSGTEFSDVINGMDPNNVWPIIDELMTAVKVINKRLYNSVIYDLKN